MKSDRVGNSTVKELDPENMAVAFLISLPSCLEAEKHRGPVRSDLPALGLCVSKICLRHLRVKLIFLRCDSVLNMLCVNYK